MFVYSFLKYQYNSQHLILRKFSTLFTYLKNLFSQGYNFFYFAPVKLNFYLRNRSYVNNVNNIPGRVTLVAFRLSMRKCITKRAVLLTFHSMLIEIQTHFFAEKENTKFLIYQTIFARNLIEIYGKLWPLNEIYEKIT